MSFILHSNSVKTQKYAIALLICFLSLITAQAQERSVNEAHFKELPNFARVNERLYRGGKPRQDGIRKLAALGINTIINLCDNDERAAAEAEEARAAGLRYFNVPFKRLGRPTDSQVDHVLSLIDTKENGVVFVHCNKGQDRTGTVIAVYRISHDEWTDQEAKKEALHFGMNFWQRGMKDYISDYFRDRSQRPARPKHTAP